MHLETTDVLTCAHAYKQRLTPHPCLQVPLNNAERVFFIVCGVCGTCFYAAVVGQMALLVASLNIVSIRHK